MMRLKVASASELPAPGGAAIDILACDLSRSPGRRAVQLVCGKRVLHTLLGRRARFVAVMIGAGGRHVVEYSEADFTELGAEVIDFVPFALGPIILTHFGLSPELREKILVGAKRRDLDTAEPAGHG